MADITISDQDRANAEVFMVSVLTTLFPDADFSPGSATRDHTIAAIGALFAVLQGEALQIRRATSLLRAPELTNADDFAEAVDNIVSNWFVTKRAGNPARGSVVIHFSAKHAGTIPFTTTFTREAGLRFVLDSTFNVVYGEDQLIPTVDTDGVIVDYTLRVPVVAEAAGTQYEISPGTFAAIDKFNRYVLFAENDSTFAGATDEETSEELLARVPEAITVRDLNSDRAIETVLREEFSTIDIVVVISMGDEGMRRDLALFQTGIQLHLGGYNDVYISAPLVTKRSFEGIVGNAFVDVRKNVTLFRDATVDDWRELPIEVGDILRARNAAASENALYVIVEITRYHLRIALQQTFPGVRPTLERDGTTFVDATVSGGDTLTSPTAIFSSLDLGRYVRFSNSGAGNDGDFQIIAVDAPSNSVTLNTASLSAESGPPLTFQIFEGLVEYSIGDFAPNYENKVAPATTGEFSRQFQHDGKILLPAEPIYRIHEVSILDPGDPDTDPITGRVQFPNRVNREPTSQSGANLEYEVGNDAPLEGQSAQQLFTVDVGYEREDSGTGGVFFGANLFQVQDANTFTAEDIGKRIFISRAVNAVNRGEHVIVAFINTTTVEVTDVGGGPFVAIAETRLPWVLTNKHKYNGKPCRVVYDTITNFDAVHAFVDSRQNRVSCANTLTRGFHPVYLRFELRYKLRATANEFFDSEGAKDAMVAFINTFPSDQILDASDIVTEFRDQNDAEVGSVQLPMLVQYTLYAPDGRAIEYETDDVVEVKALRQTGSAPEDRLDDPVELGVIDGNVRYLTSADLITLTELT